jgi:hypothetical protein
MPAGRVRIADRPHRSRRATNVAGMYGYRGWPGGGCCLLVIVAIILVVLVVRRNRRQPPPSE